MSEDDGQLVELVRQGHADGLARYIDFKRGPLLGHIEHRLGAALRRKVEPDDILQEVSAEALRSLAAIDLSERDPFGWLCQLAERRIIDAHRRFFGSQKRAAGREVPIDAGSGGTDASRAGIIDLLVASMTTASQAFSRNQKEMQLLAAMDSLSQEQREALKLRYIDGLPSKDIAERLGKSDGAVRVILSRSLARLQQLLDSGTTTT